MSIHSALPWFIPGTLAFVVIGALVCRPIARRLGTHPFVAWLLVVSVAAVVFATLAPLQGIFEASATGSGRCDLSNLSLISFRELRRHDDRMLNVVLFVPLGIAIGLLPRSRAKTLLIAASIASPFVIETTQLLVPALNRGCQGIDVIDNLTGLLAGLAFGALGGVLLRRAVTADATARAGAVVVSDNQDAPPG
jgi:glycopeptide antibiotics resistance protein